jgi:hypothetical protein
LVLYDVPQGRVIKLYDDPGGSLDDDWVEIIVRRDLLVTTIDTFESSYEDADVRVIYHRNNGLDGKVSRAVVDDDPSPALAVLYEGNNGTQNIVCTLNISFNRSVDFTSHSGCDNDEARSMVLYGVPAGRVIRVYDSPSGNESDDWAQIRTKTFVTTTTINSFQTAVSNSLVQVIPVPNNGLDGKVSRLEVDGFDVIANTPPTLTFKEGNNGTQDTVCSLSAAGSFTLNFQNSSSCDNDEARSVILTNVPAGARLRVYDDPGCGTGDDWSDINTTGHVSRYTVSSFEVTFSTQGLSQVHHHDNGLDGKVSCVRFER